jgi:PBP1b-binding outer membrane lipoprotein LpoB
MYAMKKLIVMAAVAMVAAACNSNSGSKKAEDTTSKNTMSPMKMDSTPSGDKELKAVKPIFASVDAGVTASIDKLVSDYLKIKNALVADDASATSDASRMMSGDLNGIDKSKFTAEQKEAYNKNEDDLKENAEHINKSKNDIAHQREHFSMMSDDMSDLVKAFGTSGALYTDHCPMANENKGANWLSETKQIKNPFMGKKDMTCGNVVEVIKK